MAGLLVAGLGIAALAFVRQAQRRVAANEHYDRAVAAYMLYDVDRARALFGELAREYPDLSIGVLSELKIAFLYYDAGDLNEAQARFWQFLQDHPQTISHLPETPRRDYFGELQLVAYYFLGRIAQDQGDHETARKWFETVLETGSRNPANIIVADTHDIVRRLDLVAPSGPATP